MSHTSMILSALLMLAMVVFIAPNIFAASRGNILRNIALWLAIFLGLALVYQNFGPDSPQPLFQLPESMSGMEKEKPSLPAADEKKSDESKDQDDKGEQGFTPPKE